MSATSTMETEYVSQKMLDLQLDNIKVRANAERERFDIILDTNQIVMEKNMAEIKSMFTEILYEIKNLRTEMRAEFNNVRTEFRSEINTL